MASIERIESAQNSTVRKFTQGPRYGIAGWIHKNTDLTANDLSRLSFAVTVASGAVSTYLNTHETKIPIWGKRAINGVLGLVGMGGDSIDGPTSVLEKRDRMAQADNPTVAQYSEDEIKRSVNGGRLDYDFDRAGELVLSVFRGITAYKRGSWWGVATAVGAVLTNHEPSEARAKSEQKGVFVKETPFGPEALGNRLGRGIAAWFAMVFPEIQPILDGLVTVSNKLSKKHREDEAREGQINLVIPTEPQKIFDREVASRLADIKVGDSEKFGAASRLLVAAGVAYLILKKH